MASNHHNLVRCPCCFAKEQASTVVLAVLHHQHVIRTDLCWYTTRLEIYYNSCLDKPTSSSFLKQPDLLGNVYFVVWLAIFRRNKALVKELSKPSPGSSDLYFPTQYSQSTFDQFKFCLWKQWLTYWRSPDYNLVRMVFALFTALMLGIIFWRVGSKMYVLTMLSC